MTCRRYSCRLAAAALLLGLVSASCAGTMDNVLLSDAARPIREFRAALAVPAKYALREGLRMDNRRLREAVIAFHKKHKDLILQLFHRSMDQLSHSKQPPPSLYKKIITITARQLRILALQYNIIFPLFPDVSTLIRNSLSFLPPGLVTRHGMSRLEIASWMGFLNLAQPTWHLCGHQPGQATICADYGGLDIFVIRLARGKMLWLPTSMTWWHKKDKAAMQPKASAAGSMKDNNESTATGKTRNTLKGYKRKPGS